MTSPTPSHRTLRFDLFLPDQNDKIEWIQAHMDKWKDNGNTVETWSKLMIELVAFKEINDLPDMEVHKLYRWPLDQKWK